MIIFWALLSCLGIYVIIRDMKKLIKLIIRVRQGRSNDGNEKGYIDEQIGMVRSQLYSLIGEPQENDGKKRLVKK